MNRKGRILYILFLSIPFSATLNNLNAQVKPATTTQQKPAAAIKPAPAKQQVITIQPIFPGGDDSLQRYLFMHIQAPDSLQLRDISGTIYFSFYVEMDGKTDKIRIESGPPSPGWDSAAISCIRQMPLWIPGKVNGKATAMRYFLPVFVPPGHQLFNMQEGSDGK